MTIDVLHNLEPNNRGKNNILDFLVPLTCGHTLPLAPRYTSVHVISHNGILANIKPKYLFHLASTKGDLLEHNQTIKHSD